MNSSVAISSLLRPAAFALAGVIIGLSVILRSHVSRPADLAYHAGILVALVITVVLLLYPVVPLRRDR
jgi:multisubunit Na+/H+ antiporter MnhB subunit